MQAVKSYLLIAVFLLVTAVGLAILIIAYQSHISIEVISQSLIRHVDQRLLERATQAIIERELRIQNSALWLAGALILGTTLCCAGLILRRRGQGPG
ncbi:hypothetical protein [Reinekea sp.]|jgi:hypothetical protein|uniref:hypothetical protein n=1 Tax=Reinekea sp. TaxID=1970455 RepID=UPI002A81E5FE|nr:hypothetical protein [Reinekea sp.]